MKQRKKTFDWLFIILIPAGLMEKGALPHPFGLKLPLPGSPTDNSKQCDHLARSKKEILPT